MDCGCLVFLLASVPVAGQFHLRNVAQWTLGFWQKYPKNRLTAAIPAELAVELQFASAFRLIPCSKNPANPIP
jgi:hypothetical protein